MKIKKYLRLSSFLALLLVCSSFYCQAQNWQRIDLPPEFSQINYKKVHFINDNQGIVIAFTGAIIRTTDGGDTWTEIETGATHVYYDITFANENVGFINGLKTEDGGATWIPQEATLNFTFLHAFDENHLIANIQTGANSYQESFDGGDTWTTVPIPALPDVNVNSYYPNDYSAIDEQTGYFSLRKNAFDNTLTILKTDDGGNSWDPISVPATDTIPLYGFEEISFASENTGIILHDDGILKTADGANTFLEILPDFLPEYWDPMAIHAASDDHYLLAGFKPFVSDTSINLYETLDGGITWTEAFLSPNNEFVLDVTCTSNNCFAVGTDVYRKYDPLVEVSLVVILEGAFDESTNLMRTTLANENLLPLNQPYGVAPYNYMGTESINEMPFPINIGMVDWVLVEARTGSTNDTKVDTKAGLLLNNGNIVGPDGTSPLLFDLPLNSDIHFVIRHRNHLDVMTANAMPRNATMAFDFTIETSSAFGTSQQNTLSNGQAGMIPADITQDHVIQVTDYDQWQITPALLDVYDLKDVNLDGTVQVTDYDLWFQNKAKIGPSELDY